MKSACWTRIMLTATAVALVVGNPVFAQTGTPSDGKRKVKSKTAPSYPEMARKINVSGKVKIEVVISPDGHVKSTRVIGGHPLLVQNCQQAVKEWKFTAGPEESTQIIEFEFRGSGN
ncbi:MAG TPA: energy transducer TonB [Candidatus Dormibacteraeota bacterium]|nr:energy transducer TonB [Candidatus Dormibacteraeota bacterium]